MAQARQHQNNSNEVDRGVARRQRLMAACSVAKATEFDQAINMFDGSQTAMDVRAPEVGMIMMRGRIGGDGPPFNVGEATVTRAVVRLETGEIGYSYLLGRSIERARMAAILDAIGQSSPARMSELEDAFVAPVLQRIKAARQAKQAEVATTKVNFFTMVRGDD